MNELWFLSSRNLIDLWEQREYMLANKFYPKMICIWGFPQWCTKVRTYKRVVFQQFILKITMNLDFLELPLHTPSLFSFEHSTKYKICMVVTNSSKGLCKLKDPFVVIVHLNYTTLIPNYAWSFKKTFSEFIGDRKINILSSGYPYTTLRSALHRLEWLLSN